MLSCLGKKWEDLVEELAQNKVEFVSEVSYPAGKVTPCGDLRVVRVKQEKGKLLFTLIHDRFRLSRT